MGFLLLAAGLVGLGMTLCGGVFTIGALADVLGPHRGGENYSGAVFVISVPALLLGAAMLWFVWKRFKEPTTLD